MRRYYLDVCWTYWPISLMILFTKRSHDKNTKEFKYPDEDVLVG